jgi:ferric-dicitrate binding protein FerR (iron transport regulator)
LAGVVLVLAGVAYLKLRRGSGPVAAAPSREVATRRGERGGFKLSDGTSVSLGAESRLTIPASYGSGGTRAVVLEGEAYFEVTADPARRFTVSTKFGVAEAVGTEFTVSTFPEVRGMRVVVAAGRVAVWSLANSAAARPSDSSRVVSLSKGDMVRLDRAGKATVSRVDPAAYLAWTRGAIRFDGVPLALAIPVLERWYDTDIRLADSSLAGRRLTGQFKDQSLDQVVDLIARALNLRVVRESGRITFDL